MSGSAEAETSRYYGQTESLLEHYAWYQSNSKERSWPVARLKPNDFGLFDMQGNVWEWCYDAFGSYPLDENDEAADQPARRCWMRVPVCCVAGRSPICNIKKALLCASVAADNTFSS